MDIIPSEIYQLILEKINLKSQLNFISINIFLYQELHITNLWNRRLNGRNKSIYLIDNEILAQKKFSKVTKLDINNNNKIKNISRLQNLKCLNISLNQGFITHKNKINQKIINTIQQPITKLYASDNKYITNISHMTSLTNLDISNDSNITQESINNLNLVVLNLEYNKKITDISHMNKLKKLNISGTSVITQNGINKLDLLELQIYNQSKIIDLNHMTNLVKLNASIYFFLVDYVPIGITQRNISSLTSLTELNIENNTQIFDIQHMTNLTKLNIKGTNINKESLAKLNLIELRISQCTQSYDISHMNKLKILHYTRIDNDTDNINNLTSKKLEGLDLKYLNIHDETMVYDLSHMTNLKYLNIKCQNFNYDMQKYFSNYQDSISKISSLVKLKLDNFPGYLNIQHMSNLKKIYARDNSTIDQICIDNLNMLITTLYACNNSKITNVSHLTNLTKLGVGNSNCGIDQKGITGLNLKYLNASDNQKIVSVLNMANLTYLDASYNCGISTYTIHKNITILDTYENPNFNGYQKKY